MASQNEAPARGARAIKYGTNVLVGSALFLVILGALNFFAIKSNWRADLTRSGMYTVSSATRNLLALLKDDVIITVYATEQGVPADIAEERNQLRNLLMEYRSLSKGRVKFSFKDPSADPEVQRKAEEAGIKQVEMQQVGNTEYSLKAGYFGMALQYKGKSDKLPVIAPGRSLEYQVSNAINKLAQVDTPTIGIIAPGGNPFLGDPGDFGAIAQVMQVEGFSPKSIDPNRVRDEDLKGLKMLMVIQPEELSEEVLYRIDQYVMEGGKLLVAAGGVQTDERTRRTQPKAPNINSLLENYGLRIDANLLEDWGNGLEQTYLTERGMVRRRDPFIVEVSDKSDTSPITQDLQGMVLLRPSSVSKSANGTSGSLETLIRSSQLTRKQEQMFVLDPLKLRPPDRNEASQLESYNLAMIAKGPLKSRFATVDPPVLTNDDGSTRTVAASQVKTQSPAEATVIVIGNAFAFSDQVISKAASNAFFLLNAADDLTRGGRTIALRAKQASSSRLRDITEAEATQAQALIIGGVPVALVLLGFARLQYNRMKRRRYRELYGGESA